VTLWQALAYFFREAAVNMARGLKVSFVAVATMTVSLVLGGAFLLLSGNLAQSLERFRGELKVVVYLKPGAPAGELARLAAEVRQAAWVTTVEEVTPEQARTRFRDVFPSLAQLVEESASLPPSLEIGLPAGGADRPEIARVLASWRQQPWVAMVDDDREWLSQLEAAVTVARAVAVALLAGLLGAAVFTIGSVIRLTAYLHQEEISVMRLVGATEFFIRGPFYAEGLLQGLLGGVAATGVLWGAYEILEAKSRGSLWAAFLAADFLPLSQIAWLVGLGALAGLIGSVASLRREPL
jgi:cell division transport system permease protein